MIRGQPRPVRVAEAQEEQHRPPMLGVALILATLLAPLLVLGFLWASYYAVQALGVLLVIVEAVLS